MSDDPVILTGAGILLVGGIIAAYPIVLLPIGIVAAVWLISKAAKRIDQATLARMERDREIMERADREHALVMQGDPQGMYGQYPPAEEGAQL